jgi:hypothetical protein
MGTALGNRRGGVPLLGAQARSGPAPDATRGGGFRGCRSIPPASSPPHSRSGALALGRTPRAPQPRNARVPRGPARLAHGRALACVCPRVESGGGAMGLVQGRRRRQSLPGLSGPDRSRARGGPQAPASQARSASRIPLQGGSGRAERAPLAAMVPAAPRPRGDLAPGLSVQSSSTGEINIRWRSAALRRAGRDRDHPDTRGHQTRARRGPRARPRG